MVEIKLGFGIHALYQIALDEIDPAYPQCGSGLWILEALANHLQAQLVCAVDRFAHLVAQFHRQRLLGVVGREPQVPQRQLLQQGFGVGAMTVPTEAELHPGGHQLFAELAQHHRMHQRVLKPQVDDQEGAVDAGFFQRLDQPAGIRILGQRAR